MTTLTPNIESASITYKAQLKVFIQATKNSESALAGQTRLNAEISMALAGTPVAVKGEYDIAKREFYSKKIHILNMPYKLGVQDFCIKNGYDQLATEKEISQAFNKELRG